MNYPFLYLNYTSGIRRKTNNLIFCKPVYHVSYFSSIFFVYQKNILQGIGKMIINRMLSKYSHCYAKLTYNDKEYELIFSNPLSILKDENISWEAKGCLCHIAFLEDDIELSPHVINELIKFGYLVEVV